MRIISTIWIVREAFSTRDGEMLPYIALHWVCLRIRARSIGKFLLLFSSLLGPEY